MNTATTAGTRARVALDTVFALAVALAVCVVLLLWTPLESPAAWRAASQTSTTSGQRF